MSDELEKSVKDISSLMFAFLHGHDRGTKTKIQDALENLVGELRKINFNLEKINTSLSIKK